MVKHHNRFSFIYLIVFLFFIFRNVYVKPSVKGGHMKGRVLISTAGLKDPSCCCVWIENINTVQNHVTDLFVCVCVLSIYSSCSLV